MLQTEVGRQTRRSIAVGALAQELAHVRRTVAFAAGRGEFAAQVHIVEFVVDEQVTAQLVRTAGKAWRKQTLIAATIWVGTILVWTVIWVAQTAIWVAIWAAVQVAA